LSLIIDACEKKFIEKLSETESTINTSSLQRLINLKLLNLNIQYNIAEAEHRKLTELELLKFNDLLSLAKDPREYLFNLTSHYDLAKIFEIKEK
jgi:hypothetical protein